MLFRYVYTSGTTIKESKGITITRIRSVAQRKGEGIVSCEDYMGAGNVFFKKMFCF